MDLKATRETRDIYNGFGDTLTLAMELALVPVLFAGLGHLLDRWLGTAPIFLVVLVMLSFVGLGAKMYYRYTAQMERHEAEGPWARR